MPTLYIFSGLPGSGKSTLAAMLSKSIRATYLRIDTIEQSLRDLCKLDVYDEGYQLAYKLASDNLKQGLDVVADSCNSVTESRIEWQQTAVLSAADYINIEIYCSNPQGHKHRVENRLSPVEGLVLPTWNKVTKREYQTWESQVISIDTAGKSPEQSLQELLDELEIATC